MADHPTQSDTNHHEDVALQAEEAHECQTTTASSASQPATHSLIIWTPRFIVIFLLVIVIGLSAASMLTRGSINAYYPAGWVLMAYTVVNLGSWISVSICARSSWVRLGAIFGCLWAILMGIAFAVTALPIDPDSIIQTHATVAASTALLGSFLCLSIARTSLRHWDRTFFSQVPITGTIAAIALFLITRTPTQHSYLLFEECVTTVELYACTAIWWLRSSCWQKQPGPTFLLGIAPILQLTFMRPSNGDAESFFFFSQVILLSILLGTLRILQRELRH
jgi:hypothetical protein